MSARPERPHGESPGGTATPAARKRRFRPWHLAPVLVFAGLALALLLGLWRHPEEVPSALIDKPVPEFELPPLPPRTEGLSSADFGKGEVVLVNVFASWCGPCRIEHPLLLRLSREKIVTIYGINYKDRPEDAQKFLGELGDPYERIGSDGTGRAGIAWGVYGVPETYVVDGAGRIRYKHIGYLTHDAIENTLRPLIERLREGGGP